MLAGLCVKFLLVISGQSYVFSCVVDSVIVICVIVPMQSIEHARANPGINHVKVNGVMVDGY
jgi:hypothetical protein